MEFIDTHTHIYLPEFDADRDEVVYRAVSNSVVMMLMPNIDTDSVEKMLSAESRYQGICYPMMGLHPTSVKKDYLAQLEKLEAQLKMAEAKEFRQRSLLDKDAISQESYDQVQTDVQSLKADINLIKARISETELRAPFDGTIGLRNLSEGSFATSSTKISHLIKMSPLKIEFSIPEKYASEIKVGYPLTFKIDGIDQVFNASVYAVDPKADENMRTIVLRALYPNKNEEIKSGRYAEITLQMSHKENAIAIPTEALIPEMEGVKVFILKNGKAQSVKVQTGLRTEARIQVTNGLKFGDTLITSGIMQLRQGLPIILDTVVVNK